MADLLSTNTLSAILLLIVGVVAIFLAILLLKEYMATKKTYHLAWAIAFIVLFVSGILIIFFGWDILGEPLVPVVAALIPAGLATGLVFAVWPDKKYGLLYTFYALVVILTLTVAKLELVPGFGDISSMILMAIHIPSGLIITFLPILTAVYMKSTEITSIFFGLGGLLISIGGVLLAFATVETLTPILPINQIFEVLPILLLIVGVLFVLGIGLPSKWKVSIPLLS